MSSMLPSSMVKFSKQAIIAILQKTMKISFVRVVLSTIVFLTMSEGIATSDYELGKNYAQLDMQCFIACIKRDEAAASEIIDKIFFLLCEREEAFRAVVLINETSEDCLRWFLPWVTGYREGLESLDKHALICDGGLNREQAAQLLMYLFLRVAEEPEVLKPINKPEYIGMISRKFTVGQELLLKEIFANDAAYVSINQLIEEVGKTCTFSKETAIKRCGRRVYIRLFFPLIMMSGGLFTTSF